jgi:DNA-binding transcriptional MocR family regulator
MDLRALQLAITTYNVSAVVVNPTANNPMGFTMSVADKRALVRALQRAEIPLIEDDVYGDLSAGNPRSPACKAFDETGNVLYCSSVSKTLAPGWRIGCIAPGRFFDSVLDLRVEASLGGTPVFEAAVADLLGSGDYDRHLRRFRSNTADSLRSISSRIAVTWPRGTRLTRPADGYLLWVELPDVIDAEVLCEAAREERISICPGSMFSADGSGFHNYVRINCALPATPALLAAVDRIGTLASAMLVEK